MRKLFFVSVLLAGLFCSASVALADSKTPLEKIEEFEKQLGPKVVVMGEAVLVERTIKGLIFIGDYDVLDKLQAIAKILGEQGVRVVEYRGLQDGGVEIFFSIHPEPKK